MRTEKITCDICGEDALNKNKFPPTVETANLPTLCKAQNEKDITFEKIVILNYDLCPHCANLIAQNIRMLSATMGNSTMAIEEDDGSITRVGMRFRENEEV